MDWRAESWGGGGGERGMQEYSFPNHRYWQLDTPEKWLTQTKVGPNCVS